MDSKTITIERYEVRCTDRRDGKPYVTKAYEENTPYKSSGGEIVKGQEGIIEGITKKFAELGYDVHEVLFEASVKWEMCYWAIFNYSYTGEESN